MPDHLDALDTRLNALSDELPFHVGWYVNDLRSGWSTHRHGDTVIPSASTRKVAILIAALEAVHAGRLELDQRVTPDNDLATTSGCFQWFQPGFTVTFQDLLLMMIIVSDNVATRAVAEATGLEAVQALCDRLGMAGTTHREGVPNYALPRDYGTGVSNDTTPNDQGLLLEAILDGTRDEAAAARLGVTTELCALALDIMSKQRLRSRIPARLPEHTKVASKTGTLGSNCNDVGVVYDGDEPLFILSAFTDRVPAALPDGSSGPAAADTLIANLSRATWDALKTDAR
jgi:beta-lactamase class A